MKKLDLVNLKEVYDICGNVTITANSVKNIVLDITERKLLKKYDGRSMGHDRMMELGWVVCTETNQYFYHDEPESENLNC